MSGTNPQRISITAQRVSGWIIRISAPDMMFRPPPNATPCTAAITGTGSVRQPQAACCGILVSPCVRAIRSIGLSLLAKLDRSNPAQKALPSPDTTTTRKLSCFESESMASQIASNMAGSKAFILSARVRVTWAMCADTSIETLSDTPSATPSNVFSEVFSDTLSDISSDIGRSGLSSGGLEI